MPVYDDEIKWTATYTWAAFTSAGNATKRIPCPKGKRPHIREVSGAVTTAFAGSTPGILEVGYGADPDAYFDATLTNALFTLNSTHSSSDTDPATSGFAGKMVDDHGVKDEDVLVTFTAPVGTPAGALEIFVTITWV